MIGLVPLGCFIEERFVLSVEHSKFLAEKLPSMICEYQAKVN